MIGEVADVANGIWYAAEGNYADAALSMAAAIPGIGAAATAAKQFRPQRLQLVLVAYVPKCLMSLCRKYWRQWARLTSGDRGGLARAIESS
ncbi:hypothetical protein [Streptomyces sp. NPDC086835]|uniref:hypothetical protein n=1 Tax=Streptomyces sp. NPDC086835 TaxID=3365761 RepID=UPI00381CDC05